MEIAAVADMLQPALTLEQLRAVFNPATVEADLDDFLSRGSGPYADAAAAARADHCVAYRSLDATPTAPCGDDASFALAIQLQQADEEEEAARARSAKAAAGNSGSAASDDASLALIMQLQMEDEDESARRATADSARRRDADRRDEGEALRQHLFAGGGAAAAPPPPALPPPSPNATANGPSYAVVTGMGDPFHIATAPGPLSATCAPAAAVASSGSGAVTLTAPRPPRARPPPLLIIDGANVAYNYGRDAFAARGIRLCVEYYMGRATGRRLTASQIAVVLSESRWDASDPELTYLDSLGVLTLTPVGHYDDLFLLQCCHDHDAWPVSNDAWREPRAARHATEAVRRRRITFAFCGDAFAPAADDLARFDARAPGGR